MCDVCALRQYCKRISFFNILLNILASVLKAIVSYCNISKLEKLEGWPLP